MRSMARLAPFTMRSLMGAPPRSTRSSAHSTSARCTRCDSGRYACRTMPAGRSWNSRSSSTSRKAATVTSRSRYSSMSRFTNLDETRPSGWR